MFSEGPIDPEREPARDLDRRAAHITRTGTKASSASLFGSLPPPSRSNRSRSRQSRDKSHPYLTPERRRSLPPSPFASPGTPPGSPDPDLEWDGSFSHQDLTLTGAFIDGRDRVSSDDIQQDPASITGVLRHTARASSSDEAFLDGAAGGSSSPPPTSQRRGSFPTDKGLAPLLQANLKKKTTKTAKFRQSPPWILDPSSPRPGPSTAGGSGGTQRAPSTSTPVPGVAALGDPGLNLDVHRSSGASPELPLTAPPLTDPPLQRIDQGSADLVEQRIEGVESTGQRTDAGSNPTAQPTLATPRLDDKGQPSEPPSEESGSARQQAEANRSSLHSTRGGEGLCGSDERRPLEVDPSIGRSTVNSGLAATHDNSTDSEDDIQNLGNSSVLRRNSPDDDITVPTSSAGNSRQPDQLISNQNKKQQTGKKQTINVMDPQNIIDQRIEIDRVLTTIDLEILPVEFCDDYPLDYLRQVLVQGESLKDCLTTVSSKLKHIDTEYYNQHYRPDVDRLYLGLATFIRSGQRHVQRRQVQESSERGSDRQTSPPLGATTPPHDNVKRRRVGKYTDSLLGTSEELMNKLKEVADADVSTDREAENLDEKLKIYLRDVEDHIKDLTSLSTDAYSCSMDEQAISLENSTIKLKRMKSAAVSAVLDLKTMRGMDGRGSATRQKLTDLQLPTFAGEMAPGKMDFYTFKSECTAYFKAKSLTKEEEGLVLRKSALTGAAKTLVYHLEDVDSIWTVLQEAFGMTSVLVNNKIDEIKKLGPCPPKDPEKRRDWAISALSKLNRLLTVAADHNKLDEVHHSDIIGQLRSAMPYKLVENFRKKVRENEKTNGREATKPELYDTFLDFLKETVEEETFHMRFNMQTEAPESNGKQKDSSKQGIQPSDRFTKKPQPAQPQPQPQKQGGHSLQQPQQQRQQQSGGGRRNNQKNNRQNSGAPPGPRQRLNQPAGGQGQYTPPVGVYCRVCAEEHTHLFLCKNYQSKDDLDRHSLLNLLKVCMRCMRLDSQVNLTQRSKWWNEHKANCVTDFACSANHCKNKGIWRQKHILVCSEHCEENRDEIDRFLSTLDPSQLIPNPKFYYFEPNSYASVVRSNAAGINCNQDETILPENEDPPIYLCQTLPAPEGETLLCFWDTGCTGGSMSDRAYKLLDTECVRPGPTVLNVAGGRSFELEGGDEQFKLDLAEPGQSAIFTCIHMKEVTASFPHWPLLAAFNEISDYFFKKYPDAEPLPEVDEFVGGRPADLMLGMRYNQHFPELVFMLPSGLAIYRGKLKTASGRQGVLGGCHASWNEAARRCQFSGHASFFTSEIRAFRATQRSLRYCYGFEPPEEDEEAVMLEDNYWEPGEKPSVIAQNYSAESKPLCTKIHCDQHDLDKAKLVPVHWEVSEHAHTILQDEERFWGTEDCGAIADYRCVSCRNCQRCKDSINQEKISLRQEVEQGILEASVTYNEEKGRLEGTLPFMEDPVVALAPNRYIAEKVFNAQMKTVEKRPEIKPDVIKALNKLRDRGFVINIKDVPKEDIDKMDEFPGDGYYLPWSIVTKLTSKTSPHRMVFNGSSVTSTGKSLNNIVAKGENTLARILDILIRFRAKPCAMTGDVRMAYNGIWLHPQFYKFQKFLWREDMDPNNPLDVLIIITLIYGIKSSGQQTLAGFSALAEFCASKYPEHHDGAEALKRDFYMDDLLKAVRSAAEARRVARSITFTLNLGKLEIKSYTFNGEKPEEEVTLDGVHVGALGYLWDSEKDLIRLDVKPLYFGKPKRGVLPEVGPGDFKDKLEKVFTKRTILAKVAGVYDPLGLVTPITAKLKLDLHLITDLKVDWDEKLPTFLLDTWVDNLKLIQKLNDYTFRRAVVFPEAKTPEFEIIVSMDASESICIAAVHARSEMKDGSFRCQLLTAKSKLVKGATIPRAELKAALVGTILAHTVKRNILEEFKSVTFVTDSVITLYWIQQDYRPLQVAVRNAVLEIRRFSLPDQWFHVDTKNNIGDTGTRVASLDDLKPDSEWINGRPWMTLPRDEFPLKQAQDITLNAIQLKDAAKEMKGQDIGGHVLDGLTTKVAQRYSFSNYLVDPCRLPWPKAVRALCYVYRAIKCFKKEPDVQTDLLTPEEIQAAERYFFVKGTKEVKHFCKEKQYKNISTEVDKILMYNGRTLISKELNSLENTMLDVNPLHFCKPILDRYSPISYSIMIWCHSSQTHHMNAVATLRESLEHAYIIGGRELANQVRKSCPKCRRYKQKLIEVKMGEVHPTRLTIAPAFYFTQLDLMGPMTAYSEHQHRSTINIWGAVFKCPATGAVAVHAMAKYDAVAVVKAYNRFASRYGHPRKIYIDQGTQLIAAIKNMEISLCDITNGINVEYQVGIEFELSPVGGHNFTGMVERSIKEVKRVFMDTFKGLKLDVLGYETAFAWTANELNNLPIGLGSKYRDLDHLDLITPSRLLHGRNNKRALVGCTVVKDRKKEMRQLEDVYDAWWNAWKKEKMQDFIPQPPKWKESGMVPKVGDIVIFPRTGGEALLGEMPWRIGRITTAEPGTDGFVRSVTIEYRNDPEDWPFKTTYRAVRQIAVIHREEDLEIIDQLNEASRQADQHYNLHNP